MRWGIIYWKSSNARDHFCSLNHLKRRRWLYWNLVCWMCQFIRQHYLTWWMDYRTKEKLCHCFKWSYLGLTISRLDRSLFIICFSCNRSIGLSCFLHKSIFFGLWCHHSMHFESCWMRKWLFWIQSSHYFFNRSYYCKTKCRCRIWRYSMYQLLECRWFHNYPWQLESDSTT